MIYSLRGELLIIKENFIVICCGGVGYKCMCSSLTRASLEDKLKKEVNVYTYLSVHQDSMELFGFSEERELECFKLLISVSGVGPKVALGVLSCFPWARLSHIISVGDNKSLTSAPGIGAKTAKRIILELKDKFGALDNESGETLSNDTAFTPELKNKKSEALKALMFLGYSRAEVLPWLSNLSESLSVEEMINSSLKYMGKGG